MKPSNTFTHDRLIWGAISLALLFFSTRAYAVNRSPAIDPARERASAAAFSQSSCGKAFTQVNYSASFQWKSPEGETHPMRILIGNSAARTTSAKIMNEASGECRAVCELGRKSGRLHAGMPDAIELTCRAPVLGSLETPTVLLENRIRFGSWLKGYHEAALRVDLDETGVLSEGPRMKRGGDRKLSSAVR